MNKRQTFAVTLASFCLLTMPMAYAANISKADYTAGKARIGAGYKADRAACDAQSGNAKDVCVKEAKAVEIKALADAKMGKEIGDARHDAAAEKTEADYKVALEKCDALAGDAKSNCVTAAKARFGKN